MLHCVFQTPVSEQVEVVTTETEEDMAVEHVKENDAQDFTSNKKTDEQSGKRCVPHFSNG